MKPAPFEIRTPSTLDGALRELAEAGEDSRALAGGQSLVPLLNFRMSQPEVLVDLSGVAELRYIDATDDGGIRIGAMCTQTALLESAVLRQRHPVLTEALRQVAHPPIRNRGTIGGSLAHADPAAELPAVAVLVDAVMVAKSTTGTREIPAADFFQGPYMTALQDGELLTEVRLPSPDPGVGAAIEEVAGRTGDFALAGAAVRVRPDANGKLDLLRVVVFAASTTPLADPTLDASYVGWPLDDELVDAVASAYATAVNPVGDLHGSEEYRRHLVRVVVTRALRRALTRTSTRRDPN